MPCCKVHPTRMSPEEEQCELEGDPLDWLPHEQVTRQSEVASFYDGACVLITGATGFLGMVLLEKLLRTCTGISKIYVLVRDKKGIPLRERVRTQLDGIFFSKMRQACPDYLRKVVSVAGDCELPGLGLSPEDADLLASEASVVFHVAATVRFDAILRVAAAINVRATRDLLHLARRMPNLKAFVHISTAYSNCPYSDIEEKVYPPALTTEELLRLIELMDDEQLAQILPLVMKEWPNTYTFTKAIAEDTVRTHGAGLPVSIIRPSVVISTAREPLALWINNFYGPIGVAVGVGLGILHTLQVDNNAKANLVPVDLVINATVACAWDTWRRHRSPAAEPTVFNFVSVMRHPITWGKYSHYLKHGVKYPTSLSIWYYCFVPWKTKWMHALYAIFVHLLPAAVIDAALRYKGKPAMLWNVYAKMHNLSDMLAKFITSDWNYHEDNVTSLWRSLSPADRKLFYFDIADVDWEYYFKNVTRGIRLYLGNEGFDNLDQARKRYFRLKILHYAVVTIVCMLPFLLMWWLVFP